ncbi:MAG: DinB family protein [Gemmatimonadaceae bacterium]|nr:DinB family protein [Gemmatimonadaceae bacterium]
MSMTSLHPRVAEIIDALEQAHRELVDVLTAIPDARREAPSEDGRWSIAQHVEHLAIVEDGAGRLISKLIKQVQATGEQETDESTMLRSLDRFQVWTVSRRIEAPEFVTPKESLSSSDALARLTASRSRMIDALQRASGLALASVLAPHPVVGPLNVYQWGLITAHHERRHIELIRAIAGLGE